MAYPATGQDDRVVNLSTAVHAGIPWPATHTENFNPISGKTITGATTAASAVLRLVGKAK
jgi:hypothetical protein